MVDVLEQWHAKVFAHLLAWPLSRHVDVVYAETGDGVAQCRIRVNLVVSQHELKRCGSAFKPTLIKTSRPEGRPTLFQRFNVTDY